MNVTIHTDTLRRIGYYLLLALNYSIEGLLIYASILVIESGRYIGLLLIGFFIFVRWALSTGVCEDQGADEKPFNYHWYFIVDILKQIRSMIPINVEVRK